MSVHELGHEEAVIFLLHQKTCEKALTFVTLNWRKADKEKERASYLEFPWVQKPYMMVLKTFKALMKNFIVFSTHSKVEGSETGM